MAPRQHNSTEILKTSSQQDLPLSLNISAASPWLITRMIRISSTTTRRRKSRTLPPRRVQMQRAKKPRSESQSAPVECFQGICISRGGSPTKLVLPLDWGGGVNLLQPPAASCQPSCDMPAACYGEGQAPAYDPPPQADFTS
jgi:hypothetical protein